MTVKELKTELEKYPENMEVFIAERKTEFAYGLVNSVRRKEILFTEDPSPGSEVVAKCEVIIIDEE